VVFSRVAYYKWREQHKFSSFKRVYYFCTSPVPSDVEDVMNFSFICIQDGDKIVIPECQQMIVCTETTVEDGGELCIDGEVCLLDVGV